MIKTRKIFIFGNTDYARLAKVYFDKYSEYEVAGFVVDKNYLNEEIFCGLPVISTEECEHIYDKNQYGCFVGIGYTGLNRLRKDKMDEMKKMGYELVSYIDPSSKCFSPENIGENCFIMENAVVQYNTIIKDGVHLGPCVCVAHDGVVEDCAWVAIGSMVAGMCVIGRNSFIGANATVMDGTNIAPYTVVGAGAYINRKTTKYGVYLNERSKNILKDILKNTDDAEEAQRLFFDKSMK